MNFDVEIIVSLSILLSRRNLSSSDHLIFHIIVEALRANEGYLTNEYIISKSKKCVKTVSSAIKALKNNSLISVDTKNGKNYFVCIFLEELEEILNDLQNQNLI